mmetsp:Transcript_6692/g.10819  ORF Transcript_6692/g.10819 Transcript_6692/m.10819 type:complete len:816 (+) Transcript_6692:83-2530(+)
MEPERQCERKNEPHLSVVLTLGGGESCNSMEPHAVTDALHDNESGERTGAPSLGIASMLLVSAEQNECDTSVPHEVDITMETAESAEVDEKTCTLDLSSVSLPLESMPKEECDTSVQDKLAEAQSEDALGIGVAPVASVSREQEECESRAPQEEMEEVDERPVSLCLSNAASLSLESKAESASNANRQHEVAVVEPQSETSEGTDAPRPSAAPIASGPHDVIDAPEMMESRVVPSLCDAATPLSPSIERVCSPSRQLELDDAKQQSETSETMDASSFCDGPALPMSATMEARDSSMPDEEGGTSGTMDSQMTAQEIISSGLAEAMTPLIVGAGRAFKSMAQRQQQENDSDQPDASSLGDATTPCRSTAKHPCSFSNDAPTSPRSDKVGGTEQLESERRSASKIGSAPTPLRSRVKEACNSCGPCEVADASQQSANISSQSANLCKRCGVHPINKRKALKALDLCCNNCPNHGPWCTSHIASDNVQQSGQSKLAASVRGKRKALEKTDENAGDEAPHPPVFAGSGNNIIDTVENSDGNCGLEQSTFKPEKPVILAANSVEEERSHTRKQKSRKSIAADDAWSILENLEKKSEDEKRKSWVRNALAEYEIRANDETVDAPEQTASASENANSDWHLGDVAWLNGRVGQVVGFRYRAVIEYADAVNSPDAHVECDIGDLQRGTADEWNEGRVARLAAEMFEAKPVKQAEAKVRAAEKSIAQERKLSKIRIRNAMRAMGESLSDDSEHDTDDAAMVAKAATASLSEKKKRKTRKRRLDTPSKSLKQQAETKKPKRTQKARLDAMSDDGTPTKHAEVCES